MSSSIVVEFEVLPDDAPGPSDRNPQQVFNDLQRQLADPTSQLRRGDFGGFASVACLSGPGLPGFEPVGSEKGSERPSEPAGSARSIHGYPQQASVFEAATAPDLSGRLSAVPAAAQYGSSTELQGLSNADLVDRVSQLERQLQRTAAGGRQEGLPPLSSRRATIAGEATDDRCQQLQHRLEAVERELREANEAVRMWRQRHEQCELKLKDREQLLVHAKEMWMKENVRASKLADALTAAEDKLAEQDKRLGEVAERYNDAQREVRTLQHLVGDTNGDGLVAETLGVKKNGRVLGVSTELLASPSRPLPTAGTFDNSFGAKDSSRAMPSTSPGPMSPSYLELERSLASMPLDAETNAERFGRLCLLNDAVLYEDEILQVGVKAEYAGREGQIAVFFGNKGSAALHAFTAQYFVKEEQALRLNASPLSQQLDGDKQIVQRVSVMMQEPFAEPPWLRIQFLLPDTSPRRIQMKFPIVLTKFFVGREMTAGEFFQVWRQQHFVMNEVNCIVHLAARFRGALVHVARSIVFGGALRMHHGIDSNPDNFVLVGQLVDGSRSVGVSELDRSFGEASTLTGDRQRGLSLCRVEVGSGRFAGKARVVVRSSDHTVARALCDGIVAQLAEPNAPHSDGVVAR
mmetsp:Transcript_5644/g.15885  ORF Transcript_5644/g.15885 Transcript_5644/m.15885 type:complete len:633 (-) Transcript_5644:86-1984(-)